MAGSYDTRTLVYDTAIIGGGPAGSTAAARLAQRGHRVLLLEKEQFPRFHIGESLLPCTMPLFEELGVAAELTRFLPKHAAEFVTADGALSRRYAFADGIVPGPTSAYEVDRAEFDSVLLNNAARSGAEVRQGVEVTKLSFDRADRVEIDLRGGDQVAARMVIDASGQGSLIASRRGLREMDHGLKNFAVFSHFEGAHRAQGRREGDISVVLVPEGWWWVIPLRNDRTSVGLVGPARKLAGRKPDAAYFEERIANTPYLRERLANARRVAPVRTISDYSYVSRSFAGDRWLLVGDAAAFIDPVFSTGVHLGTSGAFRAADAVDRALARGDLGRGAFREYERWLRRTVGTYRDFVHGWYQPEFAEVMMHPSDRLELRQAVTSLLAGHGTEQFGVAWRIFVFRAVTRANKRWALTPRLAGRRDSTALEG